MDFEFFFPAVRGVQAGREFYVASVPFKMLKRLMAFDTGDVLDRSQRSVDQTRAKALAGYIIKNPTTFVLPSLTGIVDGEGLQFDEYVPGSSVGKLSMPMDATIKLFDGQHRATGIMQALRDDRTIGDNVVTIQMFKGMTLDERQQAFSDINGNAKAVSASLNLAYNKRDTGLNAIADEIGRVKAWQGKIDFERNIADKKNAMLFSYRHAVQASRLLLGISAKEKPDEMSLSSIRHWWDQVAVAVEWDYHLKTYDDYERREMHQRIGNSVAFTAAGLLTLGRLGHMVTNSQSSNVPSWKVLEAMQRCINWDKSDEIWQGNLVDAKGNMVATSAAQIAAAQAIYDRVAAYDASF